MWNSLLDGMGAVLAFFFALIPSYGVAIIGLTVAVRLLLFPLTAKQARSMQKMQLIHPEIKKIQARYKDDRQKLNEEVMKFYKENKVNPLAGCLPLVAQMPIFFALFAVLRNPHKHLPADSTLYEAFCGTADRATCRPRGLSFLGMDLSLGANASHSTFTDALPYFILIALVVLTGYLQYKQTQSRQTGDVNPQAAMMGKIFPLMFAFISFSLPSGVVLYFLVSNAWQIGQQALIFGGLTPHVDAAGGTTGGNGAKGLLKGDREDRGGAKAEPSKDTPTDGRPAGKTPRESAPRPSQSGERDGFGRAQPSGSRPRQKKRRR